VGGQALFGAQHVCVARRRRGLQRPSTAGANAGAAIAMPPATGSSVSWRVSNVRNSNQQHSTKDRSNDSHLPGARRLPARPRIRNRVPRNRTSNSNSTSTSPSSWNRSSRRGWHSALLPGPGPGVGVGAGRGGRLPRGGGRGRVGDRISRTAGWGRCRGRCRYAGPERGDGSGRQWWRDRPPARGARTRSGIGTRTGASVSAFSSSFSSRGWGWGCPTRCARASRA